MGGPSSEIAESEPEEDETNTDAVQRKQTLNRAQAHHFTQDFLNDIHHFKGETEEEEMDDIEEEKDLKFKQALIRKIPNKSLATWLNSLLAFLEEFKEPERTSFAAKIEQSKPFYSLSMVFILADQ